MDHNDWIIRCEEILSHFLRRPKNRMLVRLILEDLFPDDMQARIYTLYEMLCDAMCGIRKDMILRQLYDRQIRWDHPSVRPLFGGFEEMDAFLTNPPEVEEGVIECRRCKSRRTLSYSKQTRRADESATVFVKCIVCHHAFRL